MSAFEEVTIFDSRCQEFSGDVEIRILFPIYVCSLMAFLGWWMLIFFLPTGMWAFVIENISEFVMRPKPMDDAEFNRSKAELQKKVSSLLNMGKKLASDRREFEIQNIKTWWCFKIRANMAFNRE